MAGIIPIETRLAIVRRWQETRGWFPPLTINEIATEFGVHKSTVKSSVNNINGILARAKTDIKADISNDKLLMQSIKTTETVAKPSGHLNGEIVLVIPDLHCPWEHPDALAFLKAVRKAYKPTKIVCLGDEVDFHNYSKWPKDPDVMSAGQELKEAIEHLIPFYIEFPEVQVCVSNHTIRPQKMMKLSGLPAAFFPRYSTLLNAPDGWTWHEHIIIDNVRYIHGDQGKAGQKGWTSNSEVYHRSTVVGHWHSKAGVFYDSSMFNLNAGCLIWPKAAPFDYGKNSHKKPNIGCGLVMRGKEAHYIPMQVDNDGRWTGRLHG